MGRIRLLLKIAPRRPKGGILEDRSHELNSRRKIAGAHQQSPRNNLGKGLDDTHTTDQAELRSSQKHKLDTSKPSRSSASYPRAQVAVLAAVSPPWQRATDWPGPGPGRLVRGPQYPICVLSGRRRRQHHGRVQHCQCGTSESLHRDAVSESEGLDACGTASALQLSTELCTVHCQQCHWSSAGATGRVEMTHSGCFPGPLRVTDIYI
jgi:hypothetical protein